MLYSFVQYILSNSLAKQALQSLLGDNDEQNKTLILRKFTNKSDLQIPKIISVAIGAKENEERY